MILINLLPHREAARKRRKEAFQATMFASFLVGLAIAGGIYWWYQMVITGQQDKNLFLQSEIKVLEGQIKEIASIEEEIAALRARQKAVEDLQSDRNLPVHLLSELVQQLQMGFTLPISSKSIRSSPCRGWRSRMNACQRCFAIWRTTHHGFRSLSSWKSWLRTSRSIPGSSAAWLHSTSVSG